MLKSFFVNNRQIINFQTTRRKHCFKVLGTMEMIDEGGTKQLGSSTNDPFSLLELISNIQEGMCVLFVIHTNCDIMYRKYTIENTSGRFNK
jgi:hypothetical protein